MADITDERTIGDELVDAPDLIDGEGEYPDVDVSDVQTAPTEIQDAELPDGTVRTWGPYSDYTFVTVAWGEYGVPKGKVLFFEWREVWNNKEKRFENRLMPFYVRPGEPLIADDGGLPDTIDNKG